VEFQIDTQSKQFEDGEYEAILRKMDIWPPRFEQYQIHEDKPVCPVRLLFEILDGSPSPGDPDDWLPYFEFWPNPNSVLDQMVKMVEQLGQPSRPTAYPKAISSALVGHQFRVRVMTRCSSGLDDDDVFHWSEVIEVLRLTEPVLESATETEAAGAGAPRS
jgi:hypothetical protein